MAVSDAWRRRPPRPAARPRRGANRGSLLRTICGEYMFGEHDWVWTQTLVHSLGIFDVDEARHGERSCARPTRAGSTVVRTADACPGA